MIRNTKIHNKMQTKVVESGEQVDTKIKRKVLSFLSNNFPEFDDITFLKSGIDYNKLELKYGKDKMIIELGVGEGSMYKLISTRFE